VLEVFTNDSIGIMKNLEADTIISRYTTFWIVFLETWMEGTQFVADSPSIQRFMEWNDMCIEYGGDENFSACLSSYLNSCKCSSEDKIQFLDEFS
jgi:hypothetical protein